MAEQTGSGASLADFIWENAEELMQGEAESAELLGEVTE
jgi:hypothetical protein